MKFINKIQTKDEALKVIFVTYPGKDNHNVEQWIAYGDMMIELIAKFNLTKEEIQEAQSK